MKTMNNQANEHDNTVQATLSLLWSLLPHHPSEIWTRSSDDDDILCARKDEAEGIASLIDALYGNQVTTTGYYDPEEDERNHEVDERTGYYYVCIS